MQEINEMIQALPMPVMLGFKYFWFLGALINLLNAVIMRARSGDSRSIKTARLYFILTLPFIVLGILQFLGGYTHALYIITGDFGNICFISAWILIIGMWMYSAYYYFVRIRK